MIFLLIFLFCVIYILMNAYFNKRNIWERISDDVWVSKDKRFKIYYSVNHLLWVVIDAKRDIIQTLETLEVCKDWVGSILDREKADKFPK